MQIQHKQNGGKGLFYAGEENNPFAKMTYTLPSPNKMIIDHTEVSDKLRGKNIGYELLHKAVEYARKHSFKIIPLCPFAHSVFKKKIEYADVLYINT